MADLESRMSIGSHILRKIIPNKKARRIGGVAAIAWALSSFAPIDWGWYSVKTEHEAIVTDQWSGKRTIVTQGNHFRNYWWFPVINAVMTDVDEHFMKEHIWYFRAQPDTSPVNTPTRNVRSGNDICKEENYVDVSSNDLKQTCVRAGIKFEILDLEKFAISRAGQGLDRVPEHDRPYVLTGNEFDKYIFSALQSKSQAELLKSNEKNQQKQGNYTPVEDEILMQLQNSDIEERYGFKIKAVVYDAKLPDDVATANTKKQEAILLGEGFEVRGKSDAEGWKLRLYTGALGIEKYVTVDGKKTINPMYQLSIPEILEKYPSYAPMIERYASGFIQWNVIKDRDKDGIMVVPPNTPLVVQPK